MIQSNTRLARRLMRVAVVCDVLLLVPACCASSLAAEGSGGGAAGLVVLLLALLAANAAVGVYAVNQGLIFEWQKEYVWKAVCSGIGFIGEARSFRFGLIGAYLMGDTKTIYPKLREVHGTHENWTGIVFAFVGQTIEEYNEHQAAFALAFHVPSVTFDLSDNGLISIRAGKVPVPAAYNHPGHVQTLQAPNNRALPRQALTIEEIPQGVLKAAEQFSQMRGYGQQANVWE